MPADNDFKSKIRSKLESIDSDSADFDRLADLVDQQMDVAAGGFDQHLSFYQFGNGPGSTPPPSDVPAIG